jgi:hypothetical protein
MHDIAIVLSGHDDSCCRSHSLRNLLLLIKVKNEIDLGILRVNTIDIYVHPSEFLFLYRAFAKRLLPSISINVKRNCGSLADYCQVYGCFSTVFHGNDQPSIKIYDPTLTSVHILDSLPGVKIL